MGKFMKPGRVCIVLAGRQAGKKCVIVNQHDKGTPNKKFPHALVAGVNRAPKKVTRRMGLKRLAKRSKVKPFLKYVNYNHLMPTRYQITDFNLTGIGGDQMGDREQKIAAQKNVKDIFEKKHLTSHKGDDKDEVQFFFKKLRF